MLTAKGGIGGIGCGTRVPVEGRGRCFRNKLVAKREGQVCQLNASPLAHIKADLHVALVEGQQRLVAVTRLLRLGRR